MIKLTSNLDQVTKNLKKKMENINGTHNVSIDDEAIKKHTAFNSLKELFEKAGVLEGDNNESKLSKIDIALQDDPIGSWLNLKKAISRDFVIKQLGK